MSEEAQPKPRVARIPIGAQLKMLGGTFNVTDASAKSLTLRGPLHRLKKGQILNLLGVACQVTLVGHQVARLQVRFGSIDTRPILRLLNDDEAPPEIPKGKKRPYLNAKEQVVAMEFDERLAAFQERVQRNATDEERTAILQEILNPESEPETKPE